MKLVTQGGVVLYEKEYCGSVGCFYWCTDSHDLFGTLVFSYLGGSRAVINQVETALLMQAEEAAHYVESRLLAHFSTLEAIAARPEIQSMDWSVQRPVLQSELRRLGIYEALSVVYPNGDAWHDDGTVVNVGDRDYVKRAFSGTATASDLIVNRATGTVVLGLTVPIKRNNQVVGVLMARAEAGFLSDITERLGFGEGGWRLFSARMVLLWPVLFGNMCLSSAISLQILLNWRTLAEP